MDIKEEIYNFISKHEAQLSCDLKNKDEDIEVRFTRFGNRAGCRALYDVMQMLDEDTQYKVIEMMKKFRIHDER